MAALRARSRQFECVGAALNRWGVARDFLSVNATLAHHAPSRALCNVVLPVFKKRSCEVSPRTGNIGGTRLPHVRAGLGETDAAPSPWINVGVPGNLDERVVQRLPCRQGATHRPKAA